MPLLEDLTVYEDGDDYTVYDHTEVLEQDTELGRGRQLGVIRAQADGTYVPEGAGAVYEYASPARTLDEALEAFVGSA
ncbi:hypothetical protein P5G50_08570 [Leifsonia sp. F6_8S_P_1B]|uniref:YD repeat-containing protein n=1 Tax=Leifsonia williamsii TaxID=3035919 RepID=A0ABT8KDX0_9MICO|nr:hypothetical protein [Leifsonia williamsii]MDN4614504.1 hypothetical protein [Leifsonia williamsii]